MLVGIKALIVYLWKMIWPLNLVPFYPYPKEASLASLEYLSAIVLVCGITIACLMMSRRQKLWLSAWGYYVIMLVPVLGIVQVGEQSMADRYVYLPSLGPFFLMGVLGAWVWGWAERQERRSSIARLLAVAVSAGLIISLSYLTIRQTGIWKNSIVFWSYVIEKEPEKGTDAFNNRGLAYKNMGMFDKAIADFDRAVALDPFQYKTYNNRGVVYRNMGLLDKAIGDYDKAIQLYPDHAGTYKNRGIAYFLLGQNERALKDFDKAIAISPDFADAYVNRGITYAVAGQYGRALQDFDKAILLDQNSANAYFNRGNLYLRTGNKNLALSDFRKACELGSEEGCARSAM